MVDEIKGLKEVTDRLLLADRNLQDFLTWLYTKSSTVKICCKQSSIRALYFSTSLGFDRSIDLILDYRLDSILLHDVEYFDCHHLLIIPSLNV